MSFKFRRGTDAERLQLSGGTYPIPPDGEPLWTTDTNRLYVGDGTTAGGVGLVGSGVDEYSDVVFDNITCTTLTTTGSSVHTTTVHTTDANATGALKVTGQTSLKVTTATTLNLSGDLTVSGQNSYFGYGSSSAVLNFCNGSGYFLYDTASSRFTSTAPFFSLSANTFVSGSTNLLSLFSNSLHTHNYSALTNTSHTHSYSSITSTAHTHNASNIAAGTFGSGNYTFPGGVTINGSYIEFLGNEVYIDSNGSSAESFLYFHGTDSFWSYNHTNRYFEFGEFGANSRVDLLVSCGNTYSSGPVYCNNGVFLSNPHKVGVADPGNTAVGAGADNVNGSGIWFGSGTSSNNISYNSSQSAISASTNFIAPLVTASTVCASTINLIGNIDMGVSSKINFGPTHKIYLDSMTNISATTSFWTAEAVYANWDLSAGNHVFVNRNNYSGSSGIENGMIFFHNGGSGTYDYLTKRFAYLTGTSTFYMNDDLLVSGAVRAPIMSATTLSGKSVYIESTPGLPGVNRASINFRTTGSTSQIFQLQSDAGYPSRFLMSTGLTVNGSLESTGLTATTIVAGPGGTTYDSFLSLDGNYSFSPSISFGSANSVVWRDTGRTQVSSIGMLAPAAPIYSAYSYGFIGYGGIPYDKTYIRWYTSGTTNEGRLLVNAPEFVVSAGTKIQAEGGISASTYSGITHIKSIIIPEPSASEDLPLWCANRPITITRIKAVLKGTSPGVTWELSKNSDRSSPGDPVKFSTTSSGTTSGDTYTSFDDPSVTTDQWLVLKTTATGGTIVNFAMSIEYREN